MDTANPAYKHGRAGREGFSPTYHSWACMLQRATNPKRDMAPHYMARGITVCERWKLFDNFLVDMGERPDGTTLDRHPDNNGNYEPGNCRWATQNEQSNNRRNNVRVTLDGVTHTLTKWCRILGLSRNTVYARVHQYGFTPEQALTQPKQDRAASARRMTQARIKND